MRIHYSLNQEKWDLEDLFMKKKISKLLEIYRDSTSTNELAFKDSVVRLERSNCYFYTKRILLNFRLFVLLNDSCPTNNVCNDGKPILLKRHTEFYYQVWNDLSIWNYDQKNGYELN